MQISITTVGAVLAALVAVLLTCILVPLARNIRHARATGLRYVVVPYYHYNFITARTLRKTLHPLLDYLCSKPSVTSWRVLVTALWPLKYRHAPFKVFGTDTFLIVSPGGIILNTADADVISRIFSRGSDFPKAIHIYKAVDIYGKNVVSTEGRAWRYHRKLTGPAFSEKNSQLVWRETLALSQVMLSKLLGSADAPKTVKNVGLDTMRLSLEVLGRAGLGEKLEWPADGNDEHSTTFTSSLEYISTHILRIVLVMVVPGWIHKSLPSICQTLAFKVYQDWKLRMEEMIRVRRSAIKAHETFNTDLIGQLVKAQDGEADADSLSLFNLSDSEVLGNLFVFMIAGHETSANTIHFTLIFLALHPAIQRDAQREIASILEGRPVSTWSFDKDLARLCNGLLGAVLSESLRLISPILTLPKVTHKPQSLLVDAKETVIPANILIRLCVSSVHRNPKFWPHSSPENRNSTFPLEDLENDLEEFRPERWLNENESSGGSVTTDGYQTNSTPETHRQMGAKIPRGAYIPFSDGQRSCLGKRFAQVEIIAALAVILSECSVELAVDEWACDAEVSKMTAEERENVWKKARSKAQVTLREKMTCIITVQLENGASIPLRFAKKNHERFF